MIIQDNILLLKDSIKYAGSKVIPGLMGLVAVIVFIRMIGAEEYGKYSIRFSFLMAISSFAIHWLNAATLRYYSKYQNNKLLPKIFLFSVSGSIIFGLLVLSVINGHDFLESTDQLTSAIGFFLLISLCIFQFLSALFRAQLKPNYVIIITILQSIMGLAIPIIFLKIFGQSYKYLLLGLAISYSLPPIIYFFRYIYQLKIVFKKSKDIGEYKFVLISFLKYGSPLSLWFAMSMLLPFFDRFFIEYYFAYKITGIYAGFSDLLVRVFSITLFPITMAVHPRIMFAWNNNNQTVALSLWRKAIQYQLGIIIILMAIVAIFRDIFFHLIMITIPEINITYSSLLMPLLAGSFLWQFALLCHKALEMDQRTILMVVLMFIAVCVNLIGNTIFLPHYGVIATAYTYMASAGIYIMTVIYFSRHKFILAFSNQ